VDNRPIPKRVQRRETKSAKQTLPPEVEEAVIGSGPMPTENVCEPAPKQLPPTPLAMMIVPYRKTK
jgi:hypothetical protein